MRSAVFRGPYNKDPTIWGTRLGAPILGNSRFEVSLFGLRSPAKQKRAFKNPLKKRVLKKQGVFLKTL